MRIIVSCEYTLMWIRADCRCEVSVYYGISTSIMLVYPTILLVIVLSCDIYSFCTSCNESKKINWTVRTSTF
jgi:hypothetical protein